MKIEKFGDLLRVKNKIVVDLSNMEIKERLKAICFLSGLTYRRGRLTKIACGQFLVKLGGYYENN